MQPIKLDPATFTKAEEFYMFFLAIPEEQWCVHELACGDQRCARGHLGEIDGSETPEAVQRLRKFVKYPALVNDGIDHPEYSQPTPKQRILAALRDKFGGAV